MPDDYCCTGCYLSTLEEIRKVVQKEHERLQKVSKTNIPEYGTKRILDFIDWQLSQ